MIRRHPLFWQSSGIGILAGLLFGCNADTPVAQTPPPPVTVSQPVSREILNYDEYEGRIAAVETVEVRARVRGHLEKVAFQDGEIVKKNMLLYEIDPRQYKAALDAAKAMQAGANASLDLAKKEYARSSRLAVTGAESREQLDVDLAKVSLARSSVLKADAAVEQATLDFGFTKVLAPITGKISRTQVTVGNLVNSGGGETLLSTITSVDPMYVNFDVDERSLLRYRTEFAKDALKTKGSATPIKDMKIPVEVGLEGESGYPHHGLIDFADNKVNASTGTIAIRGVLRNPTGTLSPGLRARVRVPIGERHKALMVTERAVANDQGQKFLFAVNGKDTVERRDVTLGRVVDGMQVVLAGLQPEDWVIVNGVQRARDAMKVQPERKPMPGATPPTPASGKPSKDNAANKEGGQG